MGYFYEVTFVTDSLQLSTTNHSTHSHLSDSHGIACTSKYFIALALIGVSIDIHHCMSTEAIGGSNASVGTSTTLQFIHDQRTNHYITSNL